MARRTLLISYIATYLLAIGTIIRFLVQFGDNRFWPLALLLGGYLVLLFVEPIFIRRNRNLTYIYMIVQSIIICSISIITPNVDYWAALFFPLVLQAMHNLPQRTGFLITGCFTVIVAIFMLLGIGPEVGLPLILINGVVFFFLASFIALSREAQTANVELRRQQYKLEAAHRQLQAYTTQAEELAVLHERNRLARELHDSVSQSLHSLTLLAEAAQRLADSGEIERAKGYLVRLGEISQQALKEMRLLVYELRPLELRGVGLVGAIQQRLDTVESRAGVEVNLSVEEELEIPSNIEKELYRIATEALNNSLKHANPSSVTVSLRKEDIHEAPCIKLGIIDDGSGFELSEVEGDGGLGLVSMKERVEKLGGELVIKSSPNAGTQVKACVGLNSAQNPSVSPEI